MGKEQAGERSAIRAYQAVCRGSNGFVSRLIFGPNCEWRGLVHHINREVSPFLALQNASLDAATHERGTRQEIISDVGGTGGGYESHHAEVVIGWRK